MYSLASDFFKNVKSNFHSFHIFLCLGVIVCVLYILSGLFVVLLVLCFRSLVSVRFKRGFVRFLSLLFDNIFCGLVFMYHVSLASQYIM